MRKTRSKLWYSFKKNYIFLIYIYFLVHSVSFSHILHCRSSKQVHKCLQSICRLLGFIPLFSWTFYNFSFVILVLLVCDLLYLGEANGSGHTCWIWYESFGWCYRKYHWQGAPSTPFDSFNILYSIWSPLTTNFTCLMDGVSIQFFYLFLFKGFDLTCAFKLSYMSCKL